MTENDDFHCVRCERDEAAPLTRPPFPNDLGRRVAAEICVDCWEEWKRRLMLLINHYGLDLQDAGARDFLYTNLRSFLFSEGPEGAPIDTSKEGTVDW